MMIKVFGEGPTEGRVHNKLIKLIGLRKEESKCFSSDGKDKLNTKFISQIGPDLGAKSVRCLILRDLDTHDRETEQSICQSITDALQKEFRERVTAIPSLEERVTAISRDLISHRTYSNVHILDMNEPDLRLAIHIANHQWNENFKNWNKNFKNFTTDDYLLELALKPHTVDNLAARLGISPERLSAKITDELLDLLRRNDITLSEAKNYLQLYAATIQCFSLTGFVEKILENASEQDIRDVFQSLIAAFEFVRG